MYQTYKDQAEFLFVYIREAHPGSIIPGINDGKAIKQTDTLEERRELAAETVKQLKLSFPIVVDKTDNKVNAAYAGWPERLAVVGVDGKIAYKGSKSGPGNFKPGEVEAWLKKGVFVAGPAVAEDKEKVAAREFKGKVAKVDAEKKTLTVTVDGKNKTFSIDKEAKFFIPGKKKQLQDLPGGLSGLKEGNEVTLTAETKDTKDVVTKVSVAGKKKKKDLR